MAKTPQAAPAHRVPRSTIDVRGFPSAKPAPAARLGAGEVTAIEDAETVTVVMNDEVVAGVFIQGNLPPIGEQIEVWALDDTLYSPGVDDGPTGSFTNVQTGTTYTITTDDAGAFITMDNAAASTLVVPHHSTDPIPVGSTIEGAQLGNGQVTITPEAGVIVSADPGLKVAARFGVFGLRKLAENTWVAYGRLAA